MDVVLVCLKLELTSSSPLPLLLSILYLYIYQYYIYIFIFIYFNSFNSYCHYFLLVIVIISLILCLITFYYYFVTALNFLQFCSFLFILHLWVFSSFCCYNKLLTSFWMCLCLYSFEIRLGTVFSSMHLASLVLITIGMKTAKGTLYIYIDR